MKILIGLVLIVCVALPLLGMLVLPYLHYRAHQRFNKWMCKMGITNEMLELSEKAIAEDNQQ
jgi:hypothetical protein